jgi:hypothetical protein
MECPENFLHKHLLISAEIAKISGNNADVLYSKAIEAAQENEYIQIEALSCELAAGYYLRKDKEITNKYISDSYYCFIKWGASLKVGTMKLQHPFLQNGLYEEELSKLGGFTKKVSSNHSINVVSGGTAEKLDLLSVIKASQALTEEVVLEKLLRKLMTILIENAGAQKGLLIFNRNGKYFIEAQCSMDDNMMETLHSIPIQDNSPYLSNKILYYVARTKNL